MKRMPDTGIMSSDVSDADLVASVLQFESASQTSSEGLSG